MQRRLRITLAVTAAAGAALLGAGTAYADGFSDLLGGSSSSYSPSGTSLDASSDDSDDSDSNDSDDSDDSDSGDSDSSDSSSDN